MNSQQHPRQHTYNFVAAYDVAVWTRPLENPGRFHLEANGVNITGPMIVIRRRGASELAEFVAHHVWLAKGATHLRFCVEAGAFALDKIEIKAAQ